MSDKQDKAAPVINEKMHEMAFALYRDAVNVRAGAVNPTQLAQESFARAVAFQKIAAQMDAGKLSLVTEAEEVRKLVKVPRGRMKDDQQGFEASVNPATREEVYEMVPEDPYAYAPNLPASHPINLRFQPRDGVTFDDRVKAHKRATSQPTFAASSVN